MRTQKQKKLGMEYYGITMPNAIQSREYSRGSGVEGTLYATATPMAISMSVICTSTMAGGIGATIGLTMTGTAIILRLRSQLSQVLSLFIGRVLFLQLSTPATSHFTYLINPSRKGDIFFVI